MNDVTITGKLERFQENLFAIERSLVKIADYVKTSNRDLVSILRKMDDTKEK